MIGIEDRVKVSPPTWPRRADVPPGDLTKYAPIGLGMSAPLAVMPWNSLGGTLESRSFYRSNARTGDPFHDAPINAPSGGVIYFGAAPGERHLAAMRELLDDRVDSKDYAVFVAESRDPRRDRYLAQIRIVTFSAMHLFRAIVDDDDGTWEQPITIGALIDAFIDAQAGAYGGAQSHRLEGTLGGDGDTASEMLSFGFMVENGSNGVYRLWSRPYLITK